MVNHLIGVQRRLRSSFLSRCRSAGGRESLNAMYRLLPTQAPGSANSARPQISSRLRREGAGDEHLNPQVVPSAAVTLQNSGR